MNNNEESHLILAESIGGNYLIGYKAGIKHLKRPDLPVPIKINQQKPSVMARGFVDAMTGIKPFYQHGNAGKNHRRNGIKKTVTQKSTMSFGCTLGEEEAIRAKAKLMGITPAVFMRSAVLEKL